MYGGVTQQRQQSGPARGCRHSVAGERGEARTVQIILTCLAYLSSRESASQPRADSVTQEAERAAQSKIYLRDHLKQGMGPRIGGVVGVGMTSPDVTGTRGTQTARWAGEQARQGGRTLRFHVNCSATSAQKPSGSRMERSCISRYCTMAYWRGVRGSEGAMWWSNTDRRAWCTAAGRRGQAVCSQEVRGGPHSCEIADMHSLREARWREADGCWLSLHARLVTVSVCIGCCCGQQPGMW